MPFNLDWIGSFSESSDISSMSACFLFPFQLRGQISLSNKPSDNLSVMLSLTPLEYCTRDLWDGLSCCQKVHCPCFRQCSGNFYKEQLEWVMMSVLAVFHLSCLLLKCLLLMIKSHLTCYAGSAGNFSEGLVHQPMLVLNKCLWQLLICWRFKSNWNCFQNSQRAEKCWCVWKNQTLWRVFF